MQMFGASSSSSSAFSSFLSLFLLFLFYVLILVLGAFDMLDTNKDGFITKAEWSSLLLSVAQRLGLLGVQLPSGIGRLINLPFTQLSSLTSAPLFPPASPRFLNSDSASSSTSSSFSATPAATFSTPIAISPPIAHSDSAPITDVNDRVSSPTFRRRITMPSNSRHKPPMLNFESVGKEGAAEVSSGTIAAIPEKDDVNEGGKKGDDEASSSSESELQATSPKPTSKNLEALIKEELELLKEELDNSSAVMLDTVRRLRSATFSSPTPPPKATISSDKSETKELNLSTTGGDKILETIDFNQFYRAVQLHEADLRAFGITSSSKSKKDKGKEKAKETQGSGGVEQGGSLFDTVKEVPKSRGLMIAFGHRDFDLVQNVLWGIYSSVPPAISVISLFYSPPISSRRLRELSSSLSFSRHSFLACGLPQSSRRLTRRPSSSLENHRYSLYLSIFFHPPSSITFYLSLFVYDDIFRRIPCPQTQAGNALAGPSRSMPHSSSGTFGATSRCFSLCWWLTASFYLCWCHILISVFVIGGRLLSLLVVGLTSALASSYRLDLIFGVVVGLVSFSLF